MPPKTPRGRGSARARGGRGAAAAGRAGTIDPAITPHQSDAESLRALDAPAHRVGNDEDAKPSVTTQISAEAAGTHQSSSANATASANPQDVAGSTTRPPVQRIGGLDPPRSASPVVRRGASTRGKRGTIMPPVAARRSKEERASRDKELLERERERTKEQEAAEQRKRRQAENAARRQADRAARSRGGFNGAMSGPFSLGSSREERKMNSRTTSGFGSGSGSRAARVKDEGEASGSGGGSGGGYRSGGGGPSIKREDGGFESSEDEEDAEFPRKDIDLIEISSDEDEAAPIERPQRSTLPVRIGRREHQEKTIGINTESSADIAAKAAVDSIDVSSKATTGSTRKHSTNKGKGKTALVEVATAKKPFKGVWDDPEELESPVKTEQNSEDEAMGDAEQIGIVDQPQQAVVTADPTPEAERRSKGRIKGITEPVLQTDEDRAEWARFKNNLSHIRAELGPDETAAPESSGDVNMGGTAPKPTVRDNNVYLFQIPPLMPELLSPSIKKEPVDEHAVVPPPTPAGGGDVKVKVEEGFSDPNAKGPEAPRFASGCVGKVRVRQSGRTTLDWGGTSYELTPGKKASFLQEVVSIQVVPEKDRVVPEDAGDATSLGRVKGKFVVVPDWNQMLG